jgi:cytochrome b561
MTTAPASPRYSGPARAFHWLTAILVLAAFIVGPGGREAQIYAPGSDAGRLLHETLGASVFIVVLLRLMWRLHEPPPRFHHLPAWMTAAAAIVHRTFYALLLLTPLTAVVGAWWEGHPVAFYGIGAIGPWIGERHAWGASIAEVHGFLGDAILWLAGAHAAAALYHHFVLRDEVLAAMVPGLRPGDERE